MGLKVNTDTNIANRITTAPTTAPTTSAAAEKPAAKIQIPLSGTNATSSQAPLETFEHQAEQSTAPAVSEKPEIQETKSELPKEPEIKAGIPFGTVASRTEELEKYAEARGAEKRTIYNPFCDKPIYMYYKDGKEIGSYFENKECIKIKIGNALLTSYKKHKDKITSIDIPGKAYAIDMDDQDGIINAGEIRSYSDKLSSSKSNKNKSVKPKFYKSSGGGSSTKRQKGVIYGEKKFKPINGERKGVTGGEIKYSPK